MRGIRGRRIGPSLTCLATSATLLLAGCASAPLDRTELMPVPAVFANDPFDPFDTVPPEARQLETEILFAADRGPAAEADPERHYASGRGHLVRVGRAHILHGDGELDWDSATELSLQSPRKPPYRLRVGAVEEIGILAQTASPVTDPAALPAEPDAPAAAFAAAVDRKLERSRRRDIIVYVHDFKVPFENSLLVATELGYFLGYDGVFIP